MDANCKYVYNDSSSMLTDDCVNIHSMENLHLRIKEVMEENGWEPPHVAKIWGIRNSWLISDYSSPSSSKRITVEIGTP